MATTQSNLTVLYTNRLQSVVANVASETIEHVEYYDGSNYRNILGAAELGREISPRGPETTITGTGPFTGVGWDDEYTIDGPSTDSFTGTRAWEDKAFEKDDRYNEIDPRSEKRLRTRFVWWSGISYTFPATTALDSTTLTVSSTAGFSVGQNVAGTGILGNSKILEIINATTMRMSQPATAAGSITAVFSSGTVCGWAWSDETLGVSYAPSNTTFAPTKRV